MRTKALLGLAALAVGLSTSVAQNVYSLNVVGYVNLTVTNNHFKLMSLPLAPVDGNYAISNTVILEPPAGGQMDFSSLYIYNGGTWISPTWLSGAWDVGSTVVSNGVGFWLLPTIAAGGNSTATITMVGQVQQGVLNYSAPVGFSLKAPQIPISTNWPGATIPANSFDALYQYLGGSWDSWTFLGGWSGSLPGDTSADGPYLNPGDAVWYFNNGSVPVTWSQTFTVQ